MPGKPAARASDPTACPLPGHDNNPITSGSSNVFFDGLPAARQGDTTACGSTLETGLSSSVFINGKPAAMVDSAGSHGNSVTAGSGTVIIGDTYVPLPFEPPKPVVIPGTFNRVFTFATASGKSVESLNYRLVSESGIEKAGALISGRTFCLYTRKTPEIVRIFVTSE